MRSKKEREKIKAREEEHSLPSPPLLFIAFFTSHRSPLSERLEQARQGPSSEIDGRIYHLKKFKNEHDVRPELLLIPLIKPIAFLTFPLLSPS